MQPSDDFIVYVKGISCEVFAGMGNPYTSSQYVDSVYCDTALAGTDPLKKKKV